ncbi:MAG: transglutaminase family protein [Pirellulaceae bacterium]|nr:transglutaminase family protein [Pirellulaceae bacterium]
MTIRVALQHRTSYRYDRAVMLSPQIVRLRPAPHCRTVVTAYSLQVKPEEHFLNWQQDPFGNFLARLVFPKSTRCFELEVDVVAEMTTINPFDFFLESDAFEFPFRYADWLSEELRPYLKTLPVGQRLQAFLDHVPRRAAGTVDFLVDLNRYVHEAVRYIIRLEPGVQTCDQTLSLGSGSCRDSAWLLVQVLRNLGLAARFVSGYLIQLRPDVKPLEGPAGTDHDFTDLHAWTEVYLPGAGWVGLDPTSGLLTGEGHLPLAATPDPSSAAPVTGAVDPCETTFHHEMSVRRIHEDPRVTKPYTDEQWDEITALGRRVDDVLRTSDVRLTMGGEPTFVSIDDMEGAEWNVAALGANKRKLAGTLFRRLAGRFAKGPLLHFGQGKWYPGESLPRWALGCYWRKDGQPIWHQEELIAEDDRDYGVGVAEAEAFMTTLAQRLGLSREFILPAYEDAWYYLWRERRLPVNVDPLESQLDDPETRATLARVFEQGLGRVAGYALPVRPRAGSAGAKWESGPWFLRRGRMFLLPGDSPLGFRLPLDSIPWAAAEDAPQTYEADPTAPRESLPVYPRHAWPVAAPTHHQAVAFRPASPSAAVAGPWVATLQRPHVGPGGAGIVASTSVAAQLAMASPAAPPRGKSAADVVRTALCVEPRGGRLFVFLPPVDRLEDYLDLVAAVEDTAVAVGIPVMLEGYPPPSDGRLQHLKVTPDPGVIEVNIHPSASWDELVENTVGLYDDARESRLGTEKFMLDGRHTGTGGGNHLVLGGPTPADSPFLRRPDLLRSLLAYWNNRPSLSYLLSGLFIGPTSQAPRVDEARHESLHELEIAFSQLPDTPACPPWLVDRIFRHLLVDVSGNTHRAEFCIDKLYSPDSASGRLGLVEFRAFEMPPHARMSLTQQLLMRALVARFWNRPYREPLIRWGTSLHDRFMLPHFVAQDFHDVVRELQEAGFPLREEWFAAHFEFRFPRIGQVVFDGVDVELRQAIEPWHVLGEESSGTSTSRYVDSSVERLQVKVRNLTHPRYVVTCNGRRVPLHPTGVPGEFVAGVRYRAWQPPSCLHPTIGVHAPLIFDVFDLWSRRSIGGCSWHVAHPGGRNFERFPVNALEAESRRVARFFPIGHTGGSRPEPPPERNPDYPLTLDLRRPFSSAAVD